MAPFPRTQTAGRRPGPEGCLIRAALHLHSTWSDGEFTLTELRSIFQRAGCRVIGVVDHAEAFDDNGLRGFRAECADLSDENVLLLPSLEFNCHERMHIIGYGVTERVDSEDPQTVIRHIAERGGVSVIAHPKNEAFEWIAGFDTLPDGIEGWNSKYDGRSAPRTSTFELIASLRRRKPGLHAFFGIDLHWRNQYRGLHTLIESDRPDVTREVVLERLMAGAFVGAAGDIRIPASGQIRPDVLHRLGARNRRWRLVRSAFVRAKRLADSLGIRPPAALKAQLRRLF